MDAAANPVAQSPNANTYPSLYNSGSSLDLDFGDNPFSTVFTEQTIDDPWADIKGYGQLESGLSVGSI